MNQTVFEIVMCLLVGAAAEWDAVFWLADDRGRSPSPDSGYSLLRSVVPTFWFCCLCFFRQRQQYWLSNQSHRRCRVPFAFCPQTDEKNPSSFHRICICFGGAFLMAWNWWLTNCYDPLTLLCAICCGIINHVDPVVINSVIGTKNFYAPDSPCVVF